MSEVHEMAAVLSQRWSLNDTKHHLLKTGMRYGRPWL